MATFGGDVNPDRLRHERGGATPFSHGVFLNLSALAATMTLEAAGAGVPAGEALEEWGDGEKLASFADGWNLDDGAGTDRPADSVSAGGGFMIADHDNDTFVFGNEGSAIESFATGGGLGQFIRSVAKYDSDGPGENHGTDLASIVTDWRDAIMALERNDTIADGEGDDTPDDGEGDNTADDGEDDDTVDNGEEGDTADGEEQDDTADDGEDDDALGASLAADTFVFSPDAFGDPVQDLSSASADDALDLSFFASDDLADDPTAGAGFDFSATDAPALDNVPFASQIVTDDILV